MIRTAEWAGLAPLALLAGIYWMRDRYLYNRGAGAPSRTQLLVLALYPVWILLEWATALQLARGDTAYVFVTTTGRTFVGYFTTIGVLNESFRVTAQQLRGLALGLLVSYVWALFSVLVFALDASPEACGAANATSP
jgi:hypothetical protein